MGPAIDNGPAARAMAVATGRQSRKILRMRGRQREKHCRTRPRPPGSVVAWSGMEEGKIRGHHHWAQINVNLADIFNGTSLALGRSLSVSHGDRRMARGRVCEKSRLPPLFSFAHSSLLNCTFSLRRRRRRIRMAKWNGDRARGRSTINNAMFSKLLFVRSACFRPSPMTLRLS